MKDADANLRTAGPGGKLSRNTFVLTLMFFRPDRDSRAEKFPSNRNHDLLAGGADSGR